MTFLKIFLGCAFLFFAAGFTWLALLDVPVTPVETVKDIPMTQFLKPSGAQPSTGAPAAAPSVQPAAGATQQ